METGRKSECIQFENVKCLVLDHLTLMFLFHVLKDWLIAIYKALHVANNIPEPIEV